MAEGAGTGSTEDRSVSAVARATGSAQDRETHLHVAELVAAGPTNFIFFIQHCRLNDDDSVFRSSVVAVHLSMQLAYSSIQ